MTQRTIDEFRRRSGMDGWTYYLWTITLIVATALMAWFTFRRGIAPILDEPQNFLVLAIFLAGLVTFWRGRPRTKKEQPPTRPLGLGQ